MGRKPKNKIVSREDVFEAASKLSPKDMKKLINYYCKKNTADINDEKISEFTNINLDKHLEQLGIGSSCPYCHSKIIVKNGYRKGIQRFKCCDCSKSFTRFTGTVLEKSKFYWDIWIRFIQLLVARESLKNIKRIFEKDYYLSGITIQTLIDWRWKLFNACANIPQPVLNGVVQIDETHFHESQKGVKEENMVQLFPGLERKARYSYKPAKYGVMGAEFATVITAVDEHGKVVIKVSGLGKFSEKTFSNLFKEHLGNVTWICTDKNQSYVKFCRDNNYRHYIRLSDYSKKAGKMSEEEYKKWYANYKADYIDGKDNISFAKFKKLKEKENLSLAKVNRLHSSLKTSINREHKGVSTKRLPVYMAWESVVANYLDKGTGEHITPSSEADATELLKRIILTKNNILIKDLRAMKLDLPKPSDKELQALKENTDEARRVSKRRNFVFTEEDYLERATTREMLYDVDFPCFLELVQHYQIKGITALRKGKNRLRFIQIMEKEPDIKEQILKAVARNGETIITTERKERRGSIEEISNDVALKDLTGPRMKLSALLGRKKFETFKNKTKVFFDTETTGLNPKKNGIISISIIDEEGNILLDVQCNPGPKAKWNDEAIAVNGVAPEDVADLPTIQEYIPEILKIFRTYQCIVGYNHKTFDIKFLKAAGMKGKFSDTFDLMATFTKITGASGYMNLHDVAMAYGYDWDAAENGAHTALGDAQACLFIYKKMLAHENDI